MQKLQAREENISGKQLFEWKSMPMWILCYFGIYFILFHFILPRMSHIPKASTHTHKLAIVHIVILAHFRITFDSPCTHTHIRVFALSTRNIVLKHANRSIAMMSRYRTYLTYTVNTHAHARTHLNSNSNFVEYSMYWDAIWCSVWCICVCACGYVMY